MSCDEAKAERDRITHWLMNYGDAYYEDMFGEVRVDSVVLCKIAKMIDRGDHLKSPTDE